MQELVSEDVEEFQAANCKHPSQWVLEEIVQSDLLQCQQFSFFGFCCNKHSTELKIRILVLLFEFLGLACTGVSRKEKEKEGFQGADGGQRCGWVSEV